MANEISEINDKDYEKLKEMFGAREVIISVVTTGGRLLCRREAGDEHKRMLASLLTTDVVVVQVVKTFQALEEAGTEKKGKG